MSPASPINSSSSPVSSPYPAHFPIQAASPDHSPSSFSSPSPPRKRRIYPRTSESSILSLENCSSCPRRKRKKLSNSPESPSQRSPVPVQSEPTGPPAVFVSREIPLNLAGKTPLPRAPPGNPSHKRFAISPALPLIPRRKERTSFPVGSQEEVAIPQPFLAPQSQLSPPPTTLSMVTSPPVKIDRYPKRSASSYTLDLLVGENGSSQTSSQRSASAEVPLTPHTSPPVNTLRSATLPSPEPTALLSPAQNVLSMVTSPTVAINRYPKRSASSYTLDLLVGENGSSQTSSQKSTSTQAPFTHTSPPVNTQSSATASSQPMAPLSPAQNVVSMVTSPTVAIDRYPKRSVSSYKLDLSVDENGPSKSSYFSPKKGVAIPRCATSRIIVLKTA